MSGGGPARLRVLSDLHCEFADFAPERAPADVVVLAGDIDHGVKGLEWARRHFPHDPIVYVAGNHEYYGETIPTLTDELRARAAALEVSFLENDAVELGGVRFLGCTLWTDLELFGPHPAVADIVQAAMVDYRSIRVGPELRRLRPADTVRWHRESVAWLRRFAGATGPPTVVVTHHAPSARSLAPRYAADPVSAAFASPLDGLVASLGARLWVHGHTHHSVDYAIGPTRVLGIQRGYPGEHEAGFVPDLVVEVAAASSSR